MLTQRSDRIHSIEVSFLPPISYGGDSRSAPLQTEQCESQGNESGSGRVRPGFEANQLEALYRGAAPLAKGRWTSCAVIFTAQLPILSGRAMTSTILRTMKYQPSAI